MKYAKLKTGQKVAITGDVRVPRLFATNGVIESVNSRCPMLGRGDCKNYADVVVIGRYDKRKSVIPILKSNLK